MPDIHPVGDDRHKIVPMLLFAAVILGVVPWLHPKNTCAEWLMKWGQLSSEKMWLPVHQFTMAGFLVLAAAAFMFPLLGKRSTAAVIGGGVLGAGAFVEGCIVLIHASAVATIGRAWIAAKTPDMQATLRAVAEGMVSYDEAAHSVATALVSFGAMAVILALVQEKVLSPVAGLFLAGLGSVWAAHRYHVFTKIFRFSIPETMHWDSLALWLIALAVILYRHGTVRGDRAAAEPQQTGQPLIDPVSETERDPRKSAEDAA